MSSPSSKERARVHRNRASPAFQRGTEERTEDVHIPITELEPVPLVSGVAPHDHSICERALEIHKQDSNAYATTKTYGQGHLNISAIQLQISMLLFVSTTAGRLDGYQIALVVLICIALTTEFTIFVILAVLANAKTDQIGKSGACACTATSLNALVTSMTGFLLILTTAITSVSVYAKVTGVGPHVANFTGR